MAFSNDQTGFERDATTLVLDRAPRHLNRFNRSGPARAGAVGITGHPITVEYTQDVDNAVLELALEQVTEAKAITLRNLANASGPLTAKVTPGTSETLTATINSIQFDPIVGHYTDDAPAGIRYHRILVTLDVQGVNP